MRQGLDDRLVLDAEEKPGHGAGFYTSMMIHPPVDRAYHFCGLGCMDQWRGRVKHYEALWKKWQDEHKRAGASGSFIHQSLSAEQRKEIDEEFRTAALEAFPKK